MSAASIASWSVRVFRAIDEAEQVPAVEILKPLHLVGDGNGAAERGHDRSCQLEAQIEPLGADMEQ